MNEPDSHDRDEWGDPDWDFLEEQIFEWESIPLTCGIENPDRAVSDGAK